MTSTRPWRQEVATHDKGRQKTPWDREETAAAYQHRGAADGGNPYLRNHCLAPQHPAVFGKDRQRPGGILSGRDCRTELRGNYLRTGKEVPADGAGDDRSASGRPAQCAEHPGLCLDGTSDKRTGYVRAGGRAGHGLYPGQYLLRHFTIWLPVRNHHGNPDTHGQQLWNQNHGNHCGAGHLSCGGGDSGGVLLYRAEH